MSIPWRGSVLASSLQFLHISLSPGSRSKYRRTAFAYILQPRRASCILPTTHTYSYAHVSAHRNKGQQLRSFRGAAGGAIRTWPFVFSLLFFSFDTFFFLRLAIRQTMEVRTPWTQAGLLFQSVDKWLKEMRVHVKWQEHLRGAADNQST